MKHTLFHNMKAVEARTGLSAHLIRIWERRYSAVSPARSDKRQRLYTEEEIERLRLLKRLTQSGLSISCIAKLPEEELHQLLPASEALESSHPAVSRDAPHFPPTTEGLECGRLVTGAMDAARAYDSTAMDRVLDEAMVLLGYSGTLEKFLVPLLDAIGIAWERGDFTTAHKQAGTGMIREYLNRCLPPMPSPWLAPRLVTGTPTGQMLEMGAVISGCLARKAGWNVAALGVSLPAEEFAGAALQQDARAIALNIAYPPDDPLIPAQLVRLRQLSPPAIPILASGRAVHGYRETLEDIGAIIIDHMSDFTPALSRIREMPRHFKS